MVKMMTDDGENAETRLTCAQSCWVGQVHDWVSWRTHAWYDDHDFVDDKDFDHGKEMMATLKEEWVQHISLWEAGRLPFTWIMVSIILIIIRRMMMRLNTMLLLYDHVINRNSIKPAQPAYCSEVHRNLLLCFALWYTRRGADSLGGSKMSSSVDW